MFEFRMPSLGADMEAGTLVEWLVKPGDAVKRGDIVAVVETQKGAIEIEVFEQGHVEKILVDTHAKVPVGTPLALIRTDGEAAVALHRSRRSPRRWRRPVRAQNRCAPFRLHPGAYVPRRRRGGSRRSAASTSRRSLDQAPPAPSSTPTSCAARRRQPCRSLPPPRLRRHLRQRRSGRSASISFRCGLPLRPPWRGRSGKFRIITSSIRST
jgi:pyruvate dehydrogenase E2 component (dihydrolipoamide acetyltransferase)